MITLKNFVPIALTISSISINFFGLSEPARANENHSSSIFFCATNSEGVPVTYVESKYGYKPITFIVWNSTVYWGEDFTPQARCQIVSENFQAMVTKKLNYITSGEENGYHTICAAKEYGGDCEIHLFTLPKDKEPQNVLDQIEDLQVRGNNADPYEEGSSEPLCDSEGKYCKLFELIEQIQEPIDDFTGLHI